MKIDLNIRCIFLNPFIFSFKFLSVTPFVTQKFRIIVEIHSRLRGDSDLFGLNNNQHFFLRTKSKKINFANISRNHDAIFTFEM
ncbi:hypothetical protein CIW54_10565 [Paraburkholderia sp. T12-10]|nr:hypothetical protein CIW54_10565 [Paraburkholderia sp. T12-10]